MSFLLDTHVLWDHATGNREALPDEVVQTLAVCPARDLHFLDVSLYELARHLAAGRIQVVNPLAVLRKLEQTYERIHSDAGISWTAANLNWPKRNGKGEHLDPGGRTIVAVAKIQHFTIVSADREIAAYAPSLGVKVFWN